MNDSTAREKRGSAAVTQLQPCWGRSGTTSPAAPGGLGWGCRRGSAAQHHGVGGCNGNTEMLLPAPSRGFGRGPSGQCDATQGRVGHRLCGDAQGSRLLLDPQDARPFCTVWWEKGSSGSWVLSSAAEKGVGDSPALLPANATTQESRCLGWVSGDVVGKGLAHPGLPSHTPLCADGETKAWRHRSHCTPLQIAA